MRIKLDYSAFKYKFYLLFMNSKSEQKQCTSSLKITKIKNGVMDNFMENAVKKNGGSC